jgi:hypothetical protein
VSLEPSQPSLVIRAADVQSRPVRWAWAGRLAIGYLTVQTGIEGLGKSVFAAWMLARLTRGELDGEWRGSPIDVLIVAGEDGIADTWAPRLDLAGADRNRVAFLNLASLPPGWNLRDGIDQLRAAITETGARTVFIDAALDHMPPPTAGESINSPSFVRHALGPLKQAVRDLDLVCLFSMHPPKARSADFRDLVQASQAFSAIPRVGLLLAYHPDDGPECDTRRRVLIRGKGNLGRDPGALEFRIAARIYRHDNGHATEREYATDVRPCAITLADLAPDKLVGARAPTKAEQAADIIRTALTDGQWHPAAPIRELLAQQAVDAAGVIDRAGRLAGIEKRKRPGEASGPWEWRLAHPASGALEPSTAARARSLPTSGAFDSPPPNTNNHGKAPRLHHPTPDNPQQSKAPPSTGVHAPAHEPGDGWTDDELQALIHKHGSDGPAAPSSADLTRVVETPSLGERGGVRGAADGSHGGVRS